MKKIKIKSRLKDNYNIQFILRNLFNKFIISLLYINIKNNKIINKKKIFDKYLWLSDKNKAKSHINKANQKTLNYFKNHEKELKEIENYNTRLYSNDLFEIEYKKK